MCFSITDASLAIMPYGMYLPNLQGEKDRCSAEKTDLRWMSFKTVSLTASASTFSNRCLTEIMRVRSIIFYEDFFGVGAMKDSG
jgi:hypothetical protein